MLGATGVLRARSWIASRFQRILTRTQFTDHDRKQLDTHVNGVKRRLETSFRTHQQLLIGSSARGSAIRQSSDVDLMLVLRMPELRRGDRLVSSFTTLDRVRQELESRFWNSELGRDYQAITVQFRDGQYAVDVVPGGFWGIENKIPLYLIPDGAGEWMTTSPRTHNAYIGRANLRSGGKLRNVARLAKYWRWCRTPELPLNSFHVEMLLASTLLADGAKSYGQCMYELFDSLRARRCRGLQNPLGFGGVIAVANTDAKLDKVFASVDFSAEHAGAALLAESEGEMTEAVRQWNLVFNGGFSS